MRLPVSHDNIRHVRNYKEGPTYRSEAFSVFMNQVLVVSPIMSVLP